MHNAPGMCGGESVGYLAGPFERFGERDRPVGHSAPKRLAAQEFGHEVWRAFVEADVKEGEDVRMVERPYKSSLPLESTQRTTVLRETLADDFYGDITVETRVPGTVNGSHPALPQEGQDLVRAESGPRNQNHDERLRCYSGRSLDDGGRDLHLRENRSLPRSALLRRPSPPVQWPARGRAIRDPLPQRGDAVLSRGSTPVARG